MCKREGVGPALDVAAFEFHLQAPDACLFTQVGSVSRDVANSMMVGPDSSRIGLLAVCTGCEVTKPRKMKIGGELGPVRGTRCGCCGRLQAVLFEVMLMVDWRSDR